LRGQRTIARTIDDRARFGLLTEGAPRWTWRLRLLALLAQPARAPGAPRCRVVKAGQLVFILPWLEQRYGARVVSVRRHPLDVFASQLSLARGSIAKGNHYLFQRTTLTMPQHAVRERLERWGAPPLDPGASFVTSRAYTVGFLMSAFDEAAVECKDAEVVDHEWLCEDPVARFRELVSRVGLVWAERAEQFLRDSNRPGEGFRTDRVASQQPGRWRTRLTVDEAAEARAVLRAFPIAQRYDLD
jgi:hypothetical protein